MEFHEAETPEFWNQASPGNDSPKVNERQLENLRHVRLHHWRMCDAHRVAANKISGHYVGDPADSAAIETLRNVCDYHMKIVYSLNDFFPAGDTADKDDDKENSVNAI